MIKKPEKSFVNWCNEQAENVQLSLSATGIVQKASSKNDTEVNFINTVNGHLLSTEESFNVTINSPLSSNYKELKGNGSSYKKFIHTLTIQRSVEQLNLKDCCIKNLIINLSHNAAIVNLHFDNCNICSIKITKDREEGAIDFHFTNTQIGMLNACSNSINLFKIQNGCILDILCPPPGKDNPFTGNVTIKDVFFPKDTKNYLLSGAQSYRNLRHHLLSLENSQMANLFHGYELRVERENDTFTNNIFSHAYHLISNYGSSALRPIVLLIFFAAITAIWSYCIDGAALTHTNEYYTGWRKALVWENSEGNKYRALLLSTQSIINPIGIFGAKQLVVPKTGMLALWVVIQSLFSVVFIALSIFAIRRRFKIK